MPHYLLTFLGTGQYEVEGNTRRYKTARYRLPDGQYQTSPFVAEALWNNGDYDGMVIIGTMGSMWEEVYLRFGGDQALDAQATRLYEIASQASDATPISVDWLSDLNAVLPGDSHVIVVEYGLSAESLQRNVSRLSTALQVLPKGADITLDITHGFRSQPFVAAAALQAASLRKDAPYHLKFIRYGMLETLRDHGYANVVPLDQVLRLEKAGRAAYVAQAYGRFEEYSDLLGSKHPLHGPLRLLEEALSMMRVQAAIAQLNKVSAFLQTDSPEPELDPLKWVLASLFEGMSSNPTEGQRQYVLARWYFRQRQYAAAVIFLVEAIVTRQAEMMNLPDTYSENMRKRAAERLVAEENKLQGRRFIRLRPIRNAVAHASIDSERHPDNDIAYINESIQALRPFFEV